MLTHLILMLFSMLGVSTANASDACLDGAYGIYSAKIDERRVEITEELTRHAIRILPGKSDSFRRLVAEIEEGDIVQVRELGPDGVWSCYDIIGEPERSARYRWRFGGVCPAYGNSHIFNDARVLGYYLPLIDEIERVYRGFIESVETGKPVAVTPFRQLQTQ